MPRKHTPRVFLLLHGWENHRTEGHWQRWLAEYLLTQGEIVMYPQLPDADHPRFEAWSATLERLLNRLDGARVTVVAHSLACALWLRFSQQHQVPDAVEKVVLVSVPSPDVLSGTEVRAFVDGLQRLDAPSTHALEIFASDNDPYCPEGVRRAYDIGDDVTVHIVAGGGHITGETGFGPWPGLLSVLAVDASAATRSPAVSDRPPLVG